MDAFFDQVKAYIVEHHLLPPGCKVVAGISGGADSLALLLILSRLRDPMGFDLAVAHVNHGLRGLAADADEVFVRNWCLRLSVPFFSRRIDIRTMAEVNGVSLEDAGRQARQAYFSEIAPDAIIALAHHQDDQAETILMHLGRGSGLDGLVGIKPKNGRIIHPLLGQSRRTIESWLHTQQADWCEDATNADYFALRNRLRHQVLPAWKQALGYDPAPLLNRTASLLAEDQQFLTELAVQAISTCRSDGGLSIEQLLQLPPALQSRVLRLFWAERTGSSCDLTCDHIRQLRHIIRQAGTIRQVSLPGFWRGKADGRTFMIEPMQKEVLQPFAPIPLILPGLTLIPQFNLQITALFIENDEEIVYNNEMEYFRLDRIQGSMVRLRLPGDKIHPFGRRGGKLLKKFLNEQKIRPEQRDNLPLVALDQEIVWLPGLAVGKDFVGRPGDGHSGILVRLKLQKPDDQVL